MEIHQSERRGGPGRPTEKPLLTARAAAVMFAEDRVDFDAGRADGHHRRESDQRGEERVLEHVLPGIIGNQSAQTIDEVHCVFLRRVVPDARHKPFVVSGLCASVHEPRRRGVISQRVCPTAGIGRVDTCNFSKRECLGVRMKDGDRGVCGRQSGTAHRTFVTGRPSFVAGDPIRNS